MGCDGGSAADVLRAIDRNLLPGGKLLLVEGNTLYRATPYESSEIGKSMDDPWFQMGMDIPNISATARPSAFIYSELLAGKIGQGGGPVGNRLPVMSQPQIPPSTHVTDLGDMDRQLVDELSGIIARLEARGMEVAIIVLPPGAGKDSRNIRIPIELARVAQIPFWSMTEGLPEDSYRLTDGVHMDASSASAALRTLLDELSPQNP